MKKWFLMLLTTIAILPAYAQGGKRCDFITDGSGASHGTKVKIIYPCDFTDFGPDEDRKIVKSYELKDRGVLMRIKLSIRPLSKKYTNAEAMAKFTKENITMMYEKAGGTVTFANGIHQRSSGPTYGYASYHYTESHEGQTFYTYNFDYIFYDKGNLVTLGCEALGMDDHNAKAILGHYNNYFLDLWPKTTFSE